MKDPAIPFRSLKNEIVRFRGLEERFIAMKSEYERARVDAQLACVHEHLLEAPHYDGIVFNRPPFRVCTDCGLAEEGWGCGYQILKGEAHDRGVTREFADVHVRGAIHPNSNFVVSGRLPIDLLQQILVADLERRTR